MRNGQLLKIKSGSTDELLKKLTKRDTYSKNYEYDTLKEKYSLKVLYILSDNHSFLNMNYYY